MDAQKKYNEFLQKRIVKNRAVSVLSLLITVVVGYHFGGWWGVTGVVAAYYAVDYMTGMRAAGLALLITLAKDRRE